MILSIVQDGAPDISRMAVWLVVLLIGPGLLVLVAVVASFMLRRGEKDAAAGRGYYHVMGFDKATQAHRELTLQADSPAAARGRAEMEGIIATDVRRVGDAAPA